MVKSIFDYMSEEQFARYNEIIDIATEAKKNAPKAPRAPRGPMTIEQKKKLTEGKLAKLQAKLDALMNGEDIAE